MAQTALCQEVLAKHEISPEALENLLHVRALGECDFLLVDVREALEFSQECIEGTDLLLPFTRIHLYQEELEHLKTTPFVLYCHTGGRTDYLMHVFSRMGFTQRCHLPDGIDSFRGKVLKNAPFPNPFK
ncbi:MAG: rhodanese-like domain-containing protein [Campylobacterales bacterium]|nr:rhodanese-like domain-containing protein [Campylobacterales bacterium]